MPKDRYFIEEPLEVGQEITLEGKEFHHLAHVMRTLPGKTVEVLNGKGLLATALLLKNSSSSALLRIVSLIREPHSSFSTILAQPLLQGSHLDWILEKGTELGITEFRLFPSQHSLRKDLSPTALQRIQQLLIAASKQSGRLFLPVISVKRNIKDCIQENETLLFGDLREKAPLLVSLWPSLRQTPSTCFFIGPEKGFSTGEIALLEENHGQGVSLNDGILRAETASLAALSLLRHLQLQSFREPRSFHE